MASMSVQVLWRGTAIMQIPCRDAGSNRTVMCKQRSRIQPEIFLGSISKLNLQYWSSRKRFDRKVLVRASVATGQGNNSLFVKELERVSAKEALLVAITDAGGVGALGSGRGGPSTKIEVNEKVLALERLNPTPRPTTSPLLEGFWELIWAGARSPGLSTARSLLRRLPEQVASLSSLNLEILPGGTKATAGLQLLGSVQTSFTLTTKLAVEGALRLKEEYSEGLLAPPVVQEDRIPAPLKGVVDQLTAVVESMPDAVTGSLVNGVKLPLAGTFERWLLVSYLDDEILYINDSGTGGT